jgi:hypothetical protein
MNLATSISGHSDVKDVLKDIMDNARSVVNGERASIFLADEVVGVLLSYLTDGDIPQTIPLSHGIAATTAKTKEALIVNDAYHDPRFNKLIDMHTHFKTLGVLTAPIVSSNGTVLGVAEIVNKQGGIFTVEDSTILQSFATFAALSLERHRLLDLTTRGAAEVEMCRWIGEFERREYTPPRKLVVTEDKNPEIVSLNFPTVEWNGIGLFKVAFYFFNSFNLMETFQIDNQRLFTFLFRLRSLYSESPYHNWIHAIDCLQYFCYQIRACHFESHLTPLELLAICVAALAHDVGHDGLSNVYHSNSESPLGILFKDQCTLENFHCTTLISLMASPEANLFHAVSAADQKQLWRWITTMILETDPGRHLKIVKQVQDTLDAGPINLLNPAHRLLAMVLMMKLANVSNVSRPFEIAERWCDALCEEFWREGDLEAAQGMAVSSPLNERGIGSKARGQIGFYEVVCIPLYTVIVRIFPEAEDCLTAAKKNMEIWKKKLAEEIAGQDAIGDGKYRGS